MLATAQGGLKLSILHLQLQDLVLQGGDRTVVLAEECVSGAK